MATKITNFSKLLLQPPGADGTAAGETVLQTKYGVVKLHSRPNIDGYVVEVKSEPTIVTGTHFGVECTVDAKPSTATSQTGVRGLGGIARLAATYTMTGGGLIGSYGQICNLGTLNGAGIVSAANYALIEDGGVFTAVSHLAASWLDTHLTKAISAGVYDLQYMSNNGTTQIDNAFYIYAGNKITNLFNIKTASGMVGDNQAGGAALTFTNYRLIKIVLEDETYYIPAAKTIS